MAQGDWAQTLLVGALIGLALLIRLRRMTRAQRLRPATLWIVPALFLLFAGCVFAAFPPSGRDWLWIGSGFLLGAGIGWQRARLVAITRDAETGRLYQRSASGAFLFLTMLVAARWALHYLLEASDARWHLGAALITNIVIAFAAGALLFFRIEIFLRIRRLPRPR